MNKITITGIAGALMMISGTVLAGDVAAGKAKAQVCAGCHGVDGISVAPNYPNLAGQKEQYLTKVLTDFKSGARKDPTMNAMSAPLNEADIANISAYFSSLK